MKWCRALLLSKCGRAWRKLYATGRTRECVLCAVPTLPAQPRRQPRDLAKCQVGLKTMPGPKEDASPQRQVRRADLFQFQCTFRLLRWAPLA